MFGQFVFFEQGVDLSVTNPVQILSGLAPFGFWNQMVGIFLGFGDLAATQGADQGLSLRGIPRELISLNK